MRQWHTNLKHFQGESWKQPWRSIRPWDLGFWKPFTRRRWRLLSAIDPFLVRDNRRFTVFEEEEIGLHRLDLIVGGEIIVELKAVKALEDIHYAQVKSYLKATGLRIGLLLNFNATTLAIKRVVL